MIRPIRANASTITAALICSCRGYAMCAYRQPPHSASPSDARRSTDGSSIAIVSAYATLRFDRSIRTCTRSPGIAPPTRTTWPSWRAIILPPAAGFSIIKVRDWPVENMAGRRNFGLIECDDGQSEPLSCQSIDCGFSHARERIGHHRAPKWRKLFVCFSRELDQRDIIRSSCVRPSRAPHRPPPAGLSVLAGPRRARPPARRRVRSRYGPRARRNPQAAARSRAPASSA